MKKICIVTTDVILAYQPTILNLYDKLSEHFQVEIISFAPRYISKQKIDNRSVVYLSEPSPIKWMNEGFNLFFESLHKLSGGAIGKKYTNAFFTKKLIAKTLKRFLANYTADEYIAVDFMALYVFQQVKPAEQCHFLSLEIIENDPYQALCNTDKIRSVIIQTIDRYEYLFGKNDKKVFYIQNAPASDSFYFDPVKTKSLLWAGSVLIRFGVLHCIQFIEEAKEYQLTLKGGMHKKALTAIKKRYGPLLETGRVQIDTDYLEAKDFIKYMSAFEVGICFYDIELTKHSFNYRTAPSGKLFAYYAGGVPVIALDIPGLQSVADFNAGILIKDYSFQSINNALTTIKNNYSYYFEGCKKAAEHFAFDKNCRGFINFLFESN
jgi:glycosyltransferase involved in cell wall biosynthesis